MEKYSNMPGFKKILVANRGEIAVRIIKSIHKIGMKSVSIYSEIDRFSPHVMLSDEAYPLGGVTPADSYLNIEKIIDISERAEVDAIHPGYGFLSENAEFAKSS